MKNQITTILAVCGALLASATTASAFSGGDEAGSICIFGKDVHCWIDPATYSWQKDHPAFAENEDTGTLEAETDVAMWKPTNEIKYYACFKGARGYTMDSKNSYCPHTVRPVYGRIGSISPGNHIGTDNTVVAMMSPKEYIYTTCIPHGQSSGGYRLSSHSSNCSGYKAKTYRSLSSTEPQDTDPTQMVMWGNHGGNIFDGNAWQRFWSKENWHVDTPELTTEPQDTDPTQMAMWGNHGGSFSGNAWQRFWSKENWHVNTPELTTDGETQFAHHNACGEFNCKTDEVEAPIYNDVLASTEFGNCLLNDAPIDIETLVDCRADACLGRKGYYGAVETVQ